MLIFVSTATDFFCGLKIFDQENQNKRRLFLFVSVFVNLSILGFFKYFNFFVDSLSSFSMWAGFNLSVPTFRILLPVGISFYTFQTLSYTIDVYRKKIKPANNFFDYALFVSFFPQLVMGPIERAKNLLPQIQQPRTFNTEKINEGFLLIYWGLFKKVFIADNIALFLSYFGNPVSADGSAGDGGLVLAASYAFLIQLYCDFSAYSDIARGTAMVMGFDITVNFRSPLLASNILELWERWHISLTTWIRDYLYYPLSKVKVGKKHLSPLLLFLLTFLIMGLWHGASWNFILWGLYNGLVLLIYGAYSQNKRRFNRPKQTFVRKLIVIFSILLTFNVASLGMIFFRANSLYEIGHWIYHLFANFSFSPEMVELIGKVFIYSLPLIIVDKFLYNDEKLLRLAKYPPLLKYGFLYITFFLMVVYHADATNFIYYQF